jgi:hypothetical protein
VEEERKKVIDHFDNDEQLTQYTHTHVSGCTWNGGVMVRELKDGRRKNKRRMACPVKKGKAVRRTV